MKYRRFEELPCWQDARELSKMVFELTRHKAFRRDFSFKDQIWRAAGSVMDNIAEGFDDGSTNEFVRFLGYAQRSTGEIQSQLYRALDCGYISQEQFKTVYHMASSCRKQIKRISTLSSIASFRISGEGVKRYNAWIGSSIPQSPNSLIIIVKR